MTPLARAEAGLAEMEELFAAGLGGPYAEQNLATHRSRVASLRSAATTPAPAVANPTARRTFPKLTGTREERLTRLARVMEADPATLAAALADGLEPDTFALKMADQEIARKKAAAEAAALDAVVERIAAA